MTPLSVIKGSGNEEDFSDQKLLNSLARAGSGLEEAEKILRYVKKHLYEGITTRDIYRLAFSQLKKRSKTQAANYSLKKAILALGPSGYFFEKFIASIFTQMGYKTEVEKIFEGRCVNHEVDVIATNEKETIFMECKFHNNHSKKIDIKTALYVQARHLDLQESAHSPDYQHYYLVSNSVFTKDAIDYSQCVGLTLIGLNSPEENNLYQMIKNLKLHPITCLKKLRVRDKTKLMEEGYMICRELLQNPKILLEIGLTPTEKRSVMNEMRAIVINSLSKKKDNDKTQQGKK